MTGYRVNEFADLAGVTVKALHHYDRLGLLKPRRNDTGYRIYSARDLERLEQIVALKFLGLPLKQIGTLLDKAQIDLAEALRFQRRALEEKQRRLSEAINAIADAERTIQPGAATDPAVLKRLIGLIEMQQVDLTKYYSESTLAKMQRFYEDAPSGEWFEEWKSLRSDILAAIGEDPAGETGRALAIRWRAFEKKNSDSVGWVKDPAVVADFEKLRENGGIDLPAGLLRRFRESSTAQVVPFIMKAIAALPREV